MYIKKYGRQRLESCWCAKESPKRFQSIRCGCDGEVATTECTVTGRRKYSADLAQGGFLVPCSPHCKATLKQPVGSESPLLGLK